MRRQLPPQRRSLLPEGLAIGALVHSGVLLVSTHQDPVQGAVVLGVAVVSALLDGAFDALVGIIGHGSYLLLFGFGISMAREAKTMCRNYRGVD
jgi:hypothetical protein